jgi:hypothetical protein
MQFTSPQFLLFCRRILLTASLLYKIIHITYAQTVVGMGTETPNPHAVLELVATEGNQGLLVPRLSAMEMNSLAGQLSSQDNGLLIFGHEQGSFYYWWNNQWQTLQPNDVSPTTGGNSASLELAEGHIWIGDLNSQAIALDASSDAKILVGNGTTVASVTITGDLVLQADGSLTLKNTTVTTDKLADDAVTKEKLNADVAGSGLVQAADGSLQTINTGAGELLIGQGDSLASHSLSGDVTLGADGSTTVQGLQGRAFSSAAPSTNDVLMWDGNFWSPGDAGLLSVGSKIQWYAGIATPTSIIPAEATDSDYYYDTDDNITYRKEGGNWAELGGFTKVEPAAINTGTKADSYRVPMLYIGDNKPVDGDNIGTVGDLYYSRTEEKLYYRFLDVSNGLIKWQAL